MSTLDKHYRRNFIVALVLHGAVIAGLVAWEQFLSDASFARPPGEIIEADILGDLPAGDGPGRGLYKAPEPPGPAPATQTSLPAPAPTPAPAPSQNLAGDEAAAPNEIAIPKKNVTKKPATEPKPVTNNTGTTTTQTTGKKPATNVAPKNAATNGTGKGSSYEEIKNRLANALKSSSNGTPYGDGKPAGGGTGKSGKIGSPNGREDGVVGGIGQGTPYASYYTHIHDVLYQAWDQPGNAPDKHLITTVALKIARDGSVADAAVKIGSGNKLMDDSVLTAVRKVPRLDPPPDALVRGQYAVIAVNFQVDG